MGTWIDAETASALLGVKRRTLYTYASRGWVRTRSPCGRRRLYLESDVQDLRRRADAHRGQEAAATAAMHWGPPVLPSAITSVDVDGPNYRGVPALSLAERDTPFEAVCELLWDDAGPWPPAPEPPAAEPLTGSPLDHPIRRLQRALLDRPPGVDDPVSVRERYTALVAALGAPARGSLAERIAAATRADDATAVGAALTVSADHELNPSTFAARVASSAGASLDDALLAGLATLSGAHHGGLSDAASDWLAGRAPLPDRALGHALYPDGDPRAEHLIQRALQAAPPSRRATLTARLDAIRHRDAPGLDVGLAALAHALDAAPHAALAWFSIARIAGFIAHVQEQRTQPGPVRPRARYTGP